MMSRDLKARSLEDFSMIKMQANPNAESIPLKCAESTDSTVCGWRWLSRCAEESDLASSKQ